LTEAYSAGALWNGRMTGQPETILIRLKLYPRQPSRHLSAVRIPRPTYTQPDPLEMRVRRPEGWPAKTETMTTAFGWL
jgi:hypothetical protein